MNFELKELDFKVGIVNLKDSETNVATPFYATKRLDTNKHLGVVAKNYSVLQPSEMLEIVQRLCNETGYEIYSQFAINEGKRVLLSIKTGDVKIGDDNIVKQINIANSYDRTSGVHTNFGNFTTRCSNQFSKIVKGSQFSFDHNSKMFENIENMIQAIRLLNGYEREYYDNLSKFVSTPFSKDMAVKAITEVLEIQLTNNDINFLDENTSTRKKNQLEKFINCYEKEELDLGNTLYTVMNSATNYSSHVLKQVYFGTGQKVSNDMYNKCLQYV